MKAKIFFILILSLSISADPFAQELDSAFLSEHLYSQNKLDSLFTRPNCLRGYRPIPSRDSCSTGTYSIESHSISSGPYLIHGWLYIPMGSKKNPLIVLTNGGGNGPNIRSFPDWIAPILAHCGIAAFIHDKRGTGQSEGVFKETSYDEYIADAGNCARQLSNHPMIDSTTIGIMGGSEGGRIALLAAHRFPEIKFVITYAGTVVSTREDRLYAQKGWLQSLNLPDSIFQAVWEIHEESIHAWASENPEKHAIVDKNIRILREKYNREILPSTKEEMESSPELEYILPTWKSLPNDYLSELSCFNKKWLAIFGELDQRVPTQESVRNIIKYMGESGNEKYWIAVIPNCGHAPTNVNTQRMIRLDHLIIHWLDEHVM